MHPKYMLNIDPAENDQKVVSVNDRIVKLLHICQQ